MSERGRIIPGLILLLVAVLLAVFPFSSSNRLSRTYRTKADRGWTLGKNQIQRGGTVAVNKAGSETLQTLHGIGPAFARRIIEEREKNGPFFYPEDLEAVSGIGPKTLEQFRQMLDMTADESEN